MYSVSALMHHRYHIVHRTCRVHKYKRHTCFCQRTVVATGCFTYTALQVHTFHMCHGVQAAAEIATQPIEYSYRLVR